MPHHDRFKCSNQPLAGALVGGEIGLPVHMNAVAHLLLKSGDGYRVILH